MEHVCWSGFQRNEGMSMLSREFIVAANSVSGAGSLAGTRTRAWKRTLSLFERSLSGQFSRKLSVVSGSCVIVPTGPQARNGQDANQGHASFRSSGPS